MNSAFASADRVRLTTNALIAPVGQDMIILAVDSGRYYGLNGTGAALLGWCLEDRTIGQVIDVGVERYSVDSEKLLNDLLGLLRSLSELGLIEIVPSP